MAAGIFIHWGIYAVPAYNPVRKTTPKNGIYNGSEWYLARLNNTFLYGTGTRDFHTNNYKERPYHDFLADFEAQAERFDAAAATALAKTLAATGASYVILTAKHHDGVSLYPSAYGQYHVREDLLGRLITALRQEGLKIWIYYSLMEWTECYSKGEKKLAKLGYVQKVFHPQLREIISKYHPDGIWADGDWNHTAETWRSTELLTFLQAEGIATNDRWGQGLATEKYPQMWITGKDRLLEARGQYWEHVNTIGNSWGYAQQAPGDYKSLTTIMNLYQTVHQKGGRFTLNVGLRPDGSLDPEEEKVINEVRFLREPTVPVRSTDALRAPHTPSLLGYNLLEEFVLGGVLRAFVLHYHDHERNHRFPQKLNSPLQLLATLFLLFLHVAIKKDISRFSRPKKLA